MEHSPSLYALMAVLPPAAKVSQLKTSELNCSFSSTFMKNHMEQGLEGKWNNKQEEVG